MQRVSLEPRKWESLGRESSVTFSPDGKRVLLTRGPYISVVEVLSGSVSLDGKLGRQADSPHFVPVFVRWLENDRVVMQEDLGAALSFPLSGDLTHLEEAVVFEKPHTTYERSFTHAVNSGALTLSADGSRTAFVLRNVNIGIYDTAEVATRSLFPKDIGKYLSSVAETPIAEELFAREYLQVATRAFTTAFSNGGTYLALHSPDMKGSGNVFVWKPSGSSPKVFHRFPFSTRAEVVTFSSDERYLAVASSYGALHVEDMEGKQRFFHLVTEENILDVVFVPGTPLLVVAVGGAHDEFGEATGGFPPPGVFVLNLGDPTRAKGIANARHAYFNRAVP